MSDSEAYLVDLVGVGDLVDIMPLVREAMAACPYSHDFSELEVARLTEQAAYGKYIPVDVLDRIENRMLGSLVGPVIGRARTAYRIAQITDPDLRKKHPYIKIDHFEDTGICASAMRMAGRWLEPDELLELPLRDCTHDNCTCWYRTQSHRDGPRAHPDWPPPIAADKR